MTHRASPDTQTKLVVAQTNPPCVGRTVARKDLHCKLPKVTTSRVELLVDLAFEILRERVQRLTGHQLNGESLHR